MFGMKVRPPIVKPAGDTTMTINFEFDTEWTFKAGDTLQVKIGVKEANDILAGILQELARIQK